MARRGRGRRHGAWAAVASLAAVACEAASGAASLSLSSALARAARAELLDAPFGRIDLGHSGLAASAGAGLSARAVAGDGGKLFLAKLACGRNDLRVWARETPLIGAVNLEVHVECWWLERGGLGELGELGGPHVELPVPGAVSEWPSVHLRVKCAAGICERASWQAATVLVRANGTTVGAVPLSVLRREPDVFLQNVADGACALGFVLADPHGEPLSTYSAWGLDSATRTTVTVRHGGAVAANWARVRIEEPSLGASALLSDAAQSIEVLLAADTVPVSRKVLLDLRPAGSDRPWQEGVFELPAEGPPRAVLDMSGVQGEMLAELTVEPLDGNGQRLPLDTGALEALRGKTVFTMRRATTREQTAQKPARPCQGMDCLMHVDANTQVVVLPPATPHSVVVKDRSSRAALAAPPTGRSVKCKVVDLDGRRRVLSFPRSASVRDVVARAAGVRRNELGGALTAFDTEGFEFASEDRAGDVCDASTVLIVTLTG